MILYAMGQGEKQKGQGVTDREEGGKKNPSETSGRQCLSHVDWLILSSGHWIRGNIYEIQLKT